MRLRRHDRTPVRPLPPSTQSTSSIDVSGIHTLAIPHSALTRPTFSAPQIQAVWARWLQYAARNEPSPFDYHVWTHALLRTPPDVRFSSFKQGLTTGLQSFSAFNPQHVRMLQNIVNQLNNQSFTAVTGNDARRALMRDCVHYLFHETMSLHMASAKMASAAKDNVESRTIAQPKRRYQLSGFGMQQERSKLEELAAKAEQQEADERKLDTGTAKRRWGF